jgi:positive regulator of sigma E activity
VIDPNDLLYSKWSYYTVSGVTLLVTAMVILADAGYGSEVWFAFVSVNVLVAAYLIVSIFSDNLRAARSD